MFNVKSLISAVLLISLLIFSSCSKKDEDKPVTERKEINTVQKQDSSIQNTAPLNDSILNNANSPKSDSLTTTVNKKNKDSLNLLRENKQKLIAYYFHPTARCVTCRNIEAYSIEAIQSWQEKTGNKVIWKELNIEDSVNEHYVNEYNLEFSSLILAQYSGNNRVKWKNLTDTWKLVNDKPTFLKYINFELNQFLKN